MDEVHFKGGASLYRNGAWRHDTGYRLTNNQIKFFKTKWLDNTKMTQKRC